MAKLKSWKRWAQFDDGEPYGIQEYEGAFPREPVAVIRESDYRKMRAVYNAAMKYGKEPGHFIGNEAWEKLIRACERARK